MKEHPSPWSIFPVSSMWQRPSIMILRVEQAIWMRCEVTLRRLSYLRTPFFSHLFVFLLPLSYHKASLFQSAPVRKFQRDFLPFLFFFSPIFPVSIHTISHPFNRVTFSSSCALSERNNYCRLRFSRRFSYFARDE